MQSHIIYRTKYKKKKQWIVPRLFSMLLSGYDSDRVRWFACNAIKCYHQTLIVNYTINWDILINALTPIYLQTEQFVYKFEQSAFVNVNIWNSKQRFRFLFKYLRLNDRWDYWLRKERLHFGNTEMDDSICAQCDCYPD